MDTLVEYLDSQCARRHAAQRGGHPELIVIAASGIETDDQRRTADPLREMIDVIRQIVAAGFLAGFNQNHAMSVRHFLLAQCHQGAERAKHRVSVVGPAAAVELVAFETRDPGTVTLRPADHLRLLVEVAIEQHSVLTLAGDVDEDDGGAAGQPDDLEGGARQRRQLRPRPALEQRDGLFAGPTGAWRGVRDGMGCALCIALGRRLGRRTVVAFDASPHAGNACARLPQREQ